MIAKKSLAAIISLPLIIPTSASAGQTDLQKFTECYVAYNIVAQFEASTGKGPRYHRNTEESHWWLKTAIEHSIDKYDWKREDFKNYLEIVGKKVGSLNKRQAYEMAMRCVELKAAFETQRRNAGIETGDLGNLSDSDTAEKQCPNKFVYVVDQCVPFAFLEQACRELPGADKDPNCVGND